MRQLTLCELNHYSYNAIIIPKIIKYYPSLILRTYKSLKSKYPHGQFSSVTSDTLWPHGLQHTRFPCPSPTPGAYSNSCPSSCWCHPTISFSIIPVSSCLQFFPGSASFPMDCNIRHSGCEGTQWCVVITLCVMPYKVNMSWTYRVWYNRVIVWCTTYSECDIIEGRWVVIYNACDVLNRVHVMS